MANFIPEDILQEIQSRCDIVEVITHYIPLKRAGSNFKALCPFHNERTPSFVVSPSKQIYHCFGCSAGGNVFGFVMQYERLDFVDSVKLLADRVGVVIPLSRLPGQGTVSRDLWEINKFACEVFSKWLFNPSIGKTAYNYLRKRDIKDEIIKSFMLGYAPSGNWLLKEAEKKGFSTDLLLKIGLAVKPEGRLVDMFRNRLMFPIFNPIGKVVGFSGRVLDNSLPKYINTPETLLFHKGKVLYGLHISKSEIVKQESVVICEGYFDFIRAYQEGFHNIVASQGTAFTIDQVHLLRRYTSSIIVSFDSDPAGSKASFSGLQMFLDEGIQVKIVELPKGYDPDSFIKEKGIAGFRKLISGAKDILDAKFIRLCNKYSINSIDDKLKVIGEILPDISRMKNEIRKRQFIKQVAFKLAVPEESVLLELRRLKKPRTMQRQKGKEVDFTTKKIFANKVEFPGERQLVQLLMDNELLPGCVLDGSVIDKMKHSGYKTLLELIIRLKKTNRWTGPGSLMVYVKEDGLSKLISRLSAEEIPLGLDKERIIRDCIYDIERRDKEEKIRILINRIGEAEKNRQDISDLIQEVNNLRKELINK